MKNNSALLFKRLTSDTEEILMEHLHTITGGGGSDDTIDGGELEEVVITPDPDITPEPEDDNGDFPADPEPEEDPFPEDEEENPWEDGDWDDHSDDSDPQEEQEEEEPTCTCDLSMPEDSSMIPEIKDANGILSNLKNWVTSSLDNLKNVQASDTMPQSGLDRMKKDLGFLNEIFGEIEESGRNFNFQLGDVAGSGNGIMQGYTTKDTAANEYVIRIDSSGAGSYDVNMLLAHELVHVHQILDGKLSTSGGVLYGLEDEVEAYNLQNSLLAGAIGVPNYVNKNDVAAMTDADGKAIYQGIPQKGGKCAVHG